MTSVEAGRTRRRGTVLTALVGSLVVGFGGGWAVRTMLAPAPEVLAAPGYTLVAAEQGTVGRSLGLNVTAEWSPERVVSNHAAGTVTSVELASGAEVEPSQPVYTVDLRPVVAAEGDVPAFRDLASGAEGADVVQLQELLQAAGYEVGPADGRLDRKSVV